MPLAGFKELCVALQGFVVGIALPDGVAGGRNQGQHRWHAIGVYDVSAEF